MRRPVRLGNAARAAAMWTAIALVALGCRTETTRAELVDVAAEPTVVITETASPLAAPTAAPEVAAPGRPTSEASGPTVTPEPISSPTPTQTDRDARPVRGITLVDSYDLATDTGLREPSGLALHPTSRALWSVSDTGGTLFGLDQQGDPLQTISDSGLGTDVEGLTLDDQSAWVVTEAGNWITEIDLATAEINNTQAIEDLEGYGTIGSMIESGGNNKGLEGITVDRDTDRIFVVKEGRPGVLIELSRDLSSITDHWVLDDRAGFVDPGTDIEDLDFSGLSFDPVDGTIWIVSDKGQRLFWFDPGTGQVIDSFAIDAVEKAEGIAVDRLGGLVYVVSESDATVYVYAMDV